MGKRDIREGRRDREEGKRGTKGRKEGKERIGRKKEGKVKKSLLLLISVKGKLLSKDFSEQNTPSQRYS